MPNSENSENFSYLVVFVTPGEDCSQSEIVDAKNGKEAIGKIKEKFALYYVSPTFLYVQKLD